MIKLLYVVSTLKRSGPNNQLFNLIRHLDRTKFDPHLVTLSPEPDDSRWEDFRDIGVKLFSLGLSRIQGLFFAKSKLIKLIKTLQPSLIHTQGIRADILASRLNSQIPKVSTIHNYPQEDYPMTYGNFQGKWMVKRHVSAFKKLDLCVGVSKAVEENINNLFLVDNTVNIPNGVDVEQFYPVSQDIKKNLRQKLNLPQDSQIWISTGHLSPLKAPLFLIEQWQRCFDKSKVNVLLFLGGGQLEAACKLESANSDNIILKGRVTNVVDYLQASDYFVSASKAEGLPMALIEALACGLPCLLSDIAPHVEVLSMNENIGALFQLGDTTSFADNLEKMKNQDYSIMRAATLDLVSTKLTAAVMSKSYQEQYKKLMYLHK